MFRKTKRENLELYSTTTEKFNLTLGAICFHLFDLKLRIRRHKLLKPRKMEFRL